jgi:hypothetical protein
MDPPRYPSPAMAATIAEAASQYVVTESAGSGEDFRPPPGTPLPGIDDHVVRPETPEELLHGEKLWKMPAKPPHARQHFDLASVLAAHLAEGYLGAVEMLTRTDFDSDFAPDASVYPAEPDPATGQRQLEELAFEICSEQALRVPTTKAREMVRRGVRRVFCVLVKENDEEAGGERPRRSLRRGRKETQILEWSRATDGWSSPLPGDAAIDDPCFARPLPVRALVRASERDDAVAEALRARGNRVFREERAAGRAEGIAEGRAEALVAFLEARRLAISEQERGRILACTDQAELDRWLRRAPFVTQVDELWEE